MCYVFEIKKERVVIVDDNVSVARKKAKIYAKSVKARKVKLVEVS